LVETEKSISLAAPFESSVTEMPGTSRFVTPATRGRALAVDTAPAAMTPSPRAEAALMAIQFFASMVNPFELWELVRVRIRAR
jgi:hypothetical protein